MLNGLILPPLLVAQAAWLLAPGLVVACELARRELIARYLVVPVAGVVGGVVSYAAVWIYLGNITAGKAYSYLTAALAVAAVAVLARRRDYRSVLRTADVAVPAALLLVVSLLLTSAVFGCTFRPVMSDINEACLLRYYTGDNYLPQLFADHILEGRPRTAVWDWQASARPPLQSGAVLLQNPITGSGRLHTLGYETVGVLLQVLCLPTVYALLRALRLSGYRLVAVLTMFVFTGFFVFNSVFVWPKLAAAAMTLTAFALLFYGRPTRSMWALAGLAAGAGMVSHAGVAFTLLPMGLLLLWRRYRPSWSHVGLLTVGGALMQLPWTAYQKFVDPPGNQLLLYSFAGVFQPAGSTDGRSMTEVLVDSYTEPGMSAILHNKWVNIRSLFGQPIGGPHLAGNMFGIQRAEEITYVLFGLGLFNLALLLLLVPRHRRLMRAQLDMARLRTIAIVVAVNIVIWPILMYGPGNPANAIPATIQGSYAMMALLFILLGAVLTALPRPVLALFVAANMAYTTAVWFLAVWYHHYYHWSYLSVSAVGYVLVLAVLGLAGRWLGTRPAEEPGALGGPAEGSEPGDTERRDPGDNGDGETVGVSRSPGSLRSAGPGRVVNAQSPSG
jgi:hypothetical protein